MTVVVHGKHPAYGDFLTLGLDATAQQKLDDWAQSALPKVRQTLADDWENAWSQAPDLRFWLGPDVLGVPLFGIWRTSRDKVGRHYPFIFGFTGWITSPPVHSDHDPSPFEALSDYLGLLDTIEPEKGGVQSLIKDFIPPEIVGAQFETGQNGTLWGRRNDGNIDRMLQDAQSVDAQSAQYGRSHWWHSEHPLHDAGWLAVNGLPDPATLIWLLTGRVRTSPQGDLEKEAQGSK